MPEMKLLVKNHVPTLYRLSVRDDQQNFVSPAGITMWQAPFEPGSEVFGIWEGDTAVGMIAIIDLSHPDAYLLDGDDPDSLYVWRLLVDEDHQHQGHGTFALNFAKQMMHQRGRSSVSLTAVDEPGSAIPLYEREGFVRSGRIVEDEAELVWRPE